MNATILKLNDPVAELRLELVKLQLDLEVMWSEIEAYEEGATGREPKPKTVNRLWRRYREAEKEELAMKRRLIEMTGTLKRKAV